MNVQQAVIIRIEDLIRMNKMTVNELAMISAVPPSTLKNILYGNSKNVGVITIAKLCDGFNITIREFFSVLLFKELDQEVF